MSFQELLSQGLGEEFAIGPREASRLEMHYRLLRKWNRKLNLTSIEEEGEIVVRHFCESVALASTLPQGAASIVDIGSGAGFPGVVVAILRPECRVTLVERDRRKAVFLQECTLDVSNASVFGVSSDELRERYDWLVTRAVRWSEISGVALRCCAHVALMLGLGSVEEVAGTAGWQWLQPLRLPWGDERVILRGDAVPRGTSQP